METIIHGGNPDNGCAPGGSDRGIAVPMATEGLKVSNSDMEETNHSLQAPNLKQNPIGAVAHLALSTEAATSVVLRERVHERLTFFIYQEIFFKYIQICTETSPKPPLLVQY